MNKIEMFAQLFGILDSISMMLSNWQKSKSKMMLFLITSILSIIKLKRVTDDKIIKI